MKVLSATPMSRSRTVVLQSGGTNSVSHTPPRRDGISRELMGHVILETLDGVRNLLGSIEASLQQYICVASWLAEVVKSAWDD